MTNRFDRKAICGATADIKSSASVYEPYDPALVIVRMPDVMEITGFARSTINKRLKDDPTFPRAVPLSNSTARGAPIGFVLGEVQQWVRSRIELRSEVAV